MVSGFNFWDLNVWSVILTLSIIYISILLSNFLRRTVSLFRKLLLPTSVLAGFLLLFLNVILKKFIDFSVFKISTLEILTYHGLGLGFLAVALRENKKEKGDKVQLDYFNTGLANVSIYLIQAIVGLSITLTLSFFIKSVFPCSGLILPMGFGQGPGQAYTWGKNYQDIYGFENGISFGLTIAAVGFIAASIGGVIYLHKLKREGKINFSSLGEDMPNDLNKKIFSEDEISDSESLDKLSLQFGLIFVGYFITFLIMQSFYKLFQILDVKFLWTTVNPLLWGFNFIFATVVGILMRLFLNKLYNKKIMKKKYLNNYLISKIGNVMFDIMVVASIGAISLSAFKRVEFILPLTLISVVGGVVTYYYTKFVSKKLFPDYADAQFLALYGLTTGTASTSIVLLREIDPDLETPASRNIVFQALYAIIFGFPMLLLLGIAPRKDLGNSGWAWISLLVLILLFAFMTILTFRIYIFRKRKKLKL